MAQTNVEKKTGPFLLKCMKRNRERMTGGGVSGPGLIYNRL